jgi:hypothetical protein
MKMQEELLWAVWRCCWLQACTTGLGLAYLGYREFIQLPAAAAQASAVTTGSGVAQDSNGSFLSTQQPLLLPLLHVGADEATGWQPFRPSLAALTGFGPYLALALPAVLSHCMEGWATEVLVFLSGERCVFCCECGTLCAHVNS